jgi:DNA helicase HerA-like ATPase
MTASASSPPHPYARHLAKVADGCRNLTLRASLADVRWQLQRGLLADLDRLECRPMTIRDLEPIEWHQVERLTSPVEGARLPVVDALSAVARAQSSLVILICGGTQPGVYLGVPRQRPGLSGWLSSVLAPGTLVTASGRPQPLSDFTAMSNGVLFSLVGTAEKAADRAGLPGLSRMLLSPSDSWAVMLRLDPVSFRDTRAIEDGLIECASELARFGTTSDSTNSAESLTVERPEAQLLIEDVKGRLTHLRAGEAVGLWDVSLYTSAETEESLELITASAGSVLRDETLTNARWVSQRCVAAPPASPGGGELPPPATLMSTEDVAQFLTPGQSSLPGVAVMTPPPGGRQQPRTTRPLPLGHWSGTDAVVSLDVQDLEGHAFITGTTGMGKSTTVQRLLLDLHNEHQVPFLIIDPVKADYEDLAPLIRGGLTVIDATDLVLNVLQPYEGFSTRTHLELVANAFKGSFGLPTPVPYIVAQLFERMIVRAAADPLPTLHDLRDELDPYVTSLGYHGEVESNIRASLGLRLALLLSPSKAERVAAPDGQACLRMILDKPTVVQLSTLGDDQERAFLMSVLTLYVAERARVRGRTGGSVRHVTVLEEAHRILPEPVSNASSEEGDAASVSAKLLTQMLAEIRSYGEAILVIDQSPAAVARDVVRNTNLKIAHRLPDPEDRDVVGGSLGLSEEEMPSLARLSRGEALMATRRTVEAQTVRIQPPPESQPQSLQPYRPRKADDPRLCCYGQNPTGHHAAEALSRQAERAIALVTNSMIRGSGDRSLILAQSYRDLKTLAVGDAILVADIADAVRCLAWVGFRRALVRHLSYGALDSGDLQSRHRRAFEIWEQRGSQQLRLTKRSTPEVGPFYGCRWCRARCDYRHLGEVSEEFGSRSVREGLLPVWAPVLTASTFDKVIHWMDRTESLLEPFVGTDASHDCARCAITQFAAQAAMPREEQDRLLRDDL